jgi:hypothetical protein
MIDSPGLTFQRLARMSSAERLAALTKRRAELVAEIDAARATAAVAAADGIFDEVARAKHAELTADLSEVEGGITIIEKRLFDEAAEQESQRLQRLADEREQLRLRRLEAAREVDAALAALGVAHARYSSLLDPQGMRREAFHIRAAMGHFAPGLCSVLRLPHVQVKYRRCSLTQLEQGAYSPENGLPLEEVARRKADEAAAQAAEAEPEPQPDEDGLIETIEPVQQED